MGRGGGHAREQKSPWEGSGSPVPMPSIQLVFNNPRATKKGMCSASTATP
jgi:hypothetical protein